MSRINKILPFVLIAIIALLLYLIGQTTHKYNHIKADYEKSQIEYNIKIESLNNNIQSNRELIDSLLHNNSILTQNITIISNRVVSNKKELQKLKTDKNITNVKTAEAAQYLREFAKQEELKNK